MDKVFLKTEDVERIIPDRIKESHKGTYGKVALLGGAVEYSGAIRLSAMALAALKSGAGLSTIAIPNFLVPIISQNILEVMIYPITSSDNEILFDKDNIDRLLDKMDVLACGMGLGKSEGAHEIIKYILKTFDKRLVLDADALNILSEDIDRLDNIKCKLILTPHMMEFKRLYDAAFGIEDISIDQFEKGKEARLDKFLQRFKNVTVLLKGPVTIVSNANQKVYIDRGTPGMATAGSGDVLSGILTGLLGYVENEFDAASAAAFINGLAGELAAKEEGEISMTASDTVKNIGKALKLVNK